MVLVYADVGQLKWNINFKITVNNSYISIHGRNKEMLKLI